MQKLRNLAIRAWWPFVLMIGTNMNMMSQVMDPGNLAYENARTNALDHIIDAEGGYVNKAADRGGETKHGVTANTLNELKGKHKYYLQFDTVKDMTKEGAKNVYADEHLTFHETNYGENRIALKMTEISVNTGGGKATKIMQRALNDLWQDFIIEEDGKMGDGTRGLYQETLNTFSEDAIIESLVTQQKKYYKQLVAFDDSQDIFLEGWLERAEYRPPVIDVIW